jgi:hypothetical protein
VGDYERAAGLADEVLRTFPPTVETYRTAAGILAECAHVGYRTDLPEADRREFARRCVGRLRELHRRACELPLAPADSKGALFAIKHNLAAGLANHPSGPEDVREAVELAGQVAEALPNVWQHWCTLGRARYRAGDLPGAVEALRKSMGLGSNIRVLLGGDNAWNRFILAMALWRLGDRDEAVREFHRAAQWMDRRMPNHWELRAFRAEAAELLGILAPPPRRIDRP